MADRIFEARNRHVASCGKPPDIDAFDFEFTSYFEGSCGDQWIAYWEKERKALVLLGGDIGWERPVLARNPGLILGVAEELWLKACLLVTER